MLDCITILICAGPFNGTVFAVSAGGGVILNQAYVTFPFSLPGDSIIIKKVLKNGVMALESNSNLVKNANDLVKLERNEAAAKIEKYGAMSDDLIKKISSMKSNDSINVAISIKIQPQETPLDKTKFTIDELKAQSQRFLNRTPIIDKISLMSNHGISTKILTASDSNSKDFIVVKVDRAKLSELSFDKNIVQISEHIEPVLTSYPFCAQCYDWSGIPPAWYTAACFNTLTSSAYNPASAMPNNLHSAG